VEKRANSGKKGEPCCPLEGNMAIFKGRGNLGPQHCFKNSTHSDFLHFLEFMCCSIFTYVKFPFRTIAILIVVQDRFDCLFLVILKHLSKVAINS
jgi:hypothetical protein